MDRARGALTCSIIHNRRKWWPEVRGRQRRADDDPAVNVDALASSRDPGWRRTLPKGSVDRLTLGNQVRRGSEQPDRGCWMLRDSGGGGDRGFFIVGDDCPPRTCPLWVSIILSNLSTSSL